MDRDKVIKGLECCDGYCDDETGCPYFNVLEPFDCEKQLRADAIALLKAQEPRVMTIQEVARCSMCWLEDESAPVPAPFISMEKRANGEKCDMFLAVKPDNDDCEFWYNIHEYGKTWRCWTARPTDAQREAVKWE